MLTLSPVIFKKMLRAMKIWIIFVMIIFLNRQYKINAYRLSYSGSMIIVEEKCWMFVKEIVMCNRK